jgi:hypothetical protein
MRKVASAPASRSPWPPQRRGDPAASHVSMNVPFEMMSWVPEKVVKIALKNDKKKLKNLSHYTVHMYFPVYMIFALQLIRNMYVISYRTCMALKEYNNTEVKDNLLFVNVPC